MSRKVSSDNDIDYDFRGRRTNEKVLMVVRYHAWLLMPILYIWLLLIAAVTLLIVFFGASRVSSVAIFVGLIIGAIYSLYNWFLWNNSNYIITNQRILRIEQLGLFNKEISEAEIDRIQEISTEIKGPIHTVLNFGTVHVKTASDDNRVDLENVVAPYDIQQEIARVRQEVVPQSAKNDPENGLE